VKHAVSDEKIQGKISESDKSAVLNKISEVESWIGSHPDG
jgi:hypothetical protein